MRKIFIAIGLLFFISLKDYGQTNAPLTLSTKDSIDIMEDLLNLFDSASPPESYKQIGIGISNSILSIHNKALNSKSTSPVLAFNPTFGYFDKSGFSLSGGVYLLNEDTKGFYANQFAITPAYQLNNNKNIDLGISYTHYFIQDKFSNYSSPIQNDFYGSFVYKKPFIQPGLAIGFSEGVYGDVQYLDTTIGQIKKHLYDSSTSRLTSFALIPSIQHNFEWQDIFNKKDEIEFTPALLLNLGSSRTTVTKNATNSKLIKILTKRKKLAKLQTTKFTAESVGLDLDASYVIGKFSFEPQVYLDYYLPSTDEKRFTQVFTFNVYFAF